MRLSVSQLGCTSPRLNELQVQLGLEVERTVHDLFLCDVVFYGSNELVTQVPMVLLYLFTGESSYVYSRVAHMGFRIPCWKRMSQHELSATTLHLCPLLSALHFYSEWLVRVCPGSCPSEVEICVVLSYQLGRC